MPAARPIVLVHGYSDNGASFQTWKAKLLERLGQNAPIHICNYVTLNNEITIKDLAEGFDRALRRCAGLGPNDPFDALVHSTGMLVVRSWMAASPTRRARLKHLVGIAPATFGSPLAAQGRSWLGAIFKGNRKLGPDFLNAGDQVLDGLELGSRFTWELANIDLTSKTSLYDRGPNTPYAFIFVGNQGYDGLSSMVNHPGTDGTVRWAGVAMNSRKFTLDLRRNSEGKVSLFAAPPQDLTIPMYPIDGVNHGTIVGAPPDTLVSMVCDAFAVNNDADFDKWSANAANTTADTLKSMPKWQQFVVRAIDDRGDPITDYNLEIKYQNKSLLNFLQPTSQFKIDVHAYGADKSLRCFHVNLDDLQKIVDLKDAHVKIHVIASSGSQLVTYSSSMEFQPDQPKAETLDNQGNLDIEVDLTPLFTGSTKLFFPFTTTLIELIITREPTPLDYSQPCQIFELLGDSPAARK